MICFVNGEPGVIFQVDPISGDVNDILKVILHSKNREVYLVFPSLIYFTKPETRILIDEHIQQGLSPGWEKQPIDDPSLLNLKGVIVIKYKKTR
jgi:hypothetical protein